MTNDISDELKTFLTPVFKRKFASVAALNVKELSSYTDTIIIIECNSIRQVSSFAQYLIKAFKQLEIAAIGMEGLQNSEWALLDFGEVVIHILESRARSFFDIEGLWADAPRIDLSMFETAPPLNS